MPKTTSDLDKYTTEALRRTQEELNWYRTLYDKTPPGIFFTLDTTGKILSVNQFRCKLFGLCTL